MSRFPFSRKQPPKSRRVVITVDPADARDKVAHYAGTTRDWAAPKVVVTREWAAPRVDAAKDWAGPKVGAAKESLAPRVEPALAKVKQDVVPAVAGAVTTALAAAEPVRSEAVSRGSAALAALKGEVQAPKPKKHRLRKLVLLASVLGAAYAGWKAWSASNGSDPVDAWTSSSTTGSYGTPPVADPVAEPVVDLSAVAAEDRPETDDPGGAGPDEALADAADEADDSGPTAVTEQVTPTQSRKAADTADKGPDAV